MEMKLLRILCAFGKHNLTNCQCSRCGKVQHKWHILLKELKELKFSPEIRIYMDLGYALRNPTEAKEYAQELRRNAFQRALETPPWRFEVIYEIKQRCDVCGKEEMNPNAQIGDYINVSAEEASLFDGAKNVAQAKLSSRSGQS